MEPYSVLIISDENEFVRALMARWQAEQSVPGFTLVSSDLWTGGSVISAELVIVGPVRGGRLPAILHALDHAATACICVVREASVAASLRAEYSRLLVMPQHDGWADAVLLIASEALRRQEAVARARRAERAAAASQGLATLGRYILEMRHNLNNALTSVIGNADLLLLEPGQSSAAARDQIKTIHLMSLRLHEIMQRFSSLASEMEVVEKESQGEMETPSQAPVSGD